MLVEDVGAVSSHIQFLKASQEGALATTSGTGGWCWPRPGEEGTEAVTGRGPRLGGQGESHVPLLARGPHFQLWPPREHLLAPLSILGPPCPSWHALSFLYSSGSS